MSRLRRYASLAVPGAVLALVLALRVFDPGGVLEEVRLRVFDGYQRLSPRVAEASAVRVIDIDDESLSRIGQWPWPRTVIADLVTRLSGAGALAVALDIVFPEADRTSPSEVTKFWPQAEGLRPLLAQLPDHDAVFAEALAASPSITGFALTGDANDRVPVRKGSFAHAGIDPRPFIPGFSGAVASLPVLEGAARGNGSLNQVPEPDGMLRRVPLVLRLGDRIYSSLVTEALRVAQGAGTIIIRASGAQATASFGAETGIDSIKIGDFVVPTDANGKFWLHYAPISRERTVPAWKVLAGEAGEDTFDGTIVLVGTSAAGLLDLRPSPLDPALPGIEAHAQAIEQILAGRALERPDWADGAEILYVAALGLALVLALRRIGALWSAAAGAGAAALAVTASWQAFRHVGFLVDPVTPFAATLAVYVAATLISYIAAEREKREVRTAFSQYLAPAMVERLAADPSQLKLGGETREMTFLFCDVRGFTTISEGYKSDPQALTRLINKFLTPMTDRILASRGTIDKYMGDCIMAFWGAPLANPEHAHAGVVAGLEMHRVLNELQPKFKEKYKLEIKIGVGLNTGRMSVGNMGSQIRRAYTVMGDAVNLASRLEGITKEYGADIIVGEETMKAAPELVFRELDRVCVKGKENAVTIYQPIGLRSEVSADTIKLLEAFQEALATYRRQEWDKAESLLKVLKETSYGNKLYDLFLSRIPVLREKDLGPNWDGAFTFETK